MLFVRERMAALLGSLAGQGVYLGTASWRYQGWCGTLYDEDRYLWGSHFSKAKFNRECLREYAEVFRTTEIDWTFYRLPKPGELEEKVEGAALPGGFLFSLKAPCSLTMRHFPDIRDFGDRAGQQSDSFLDEGFFEFAFLRRLAPIRAHVGAIVFEFSHFTPDDFAHGRDFVGLLDRFLADLPDDWRYAVEVRNPNLLHPEYFAVLRAHGVAHAYNQWTQMPAAEEQIALAPPEDQAFLAGRFLLSPGRSQHAAERDFAPYHQLREIDEPARRALRQLIATRRALPPQAPPAFLYVANGLEGNALHTIADIAAESAADA